MIRFPCEHSSNCRLRPSTIEFSELIFDLSLVDFSLIGGAFTWSNNHMWSRLKIFLVFLEWETHFLDVCQKRLTRLCSDNFPILLGCAGF